MASLDGIAAQRISSDTASPSRAAVTLSSVRSAFATALGNIKPTDALIVGMYQQFSDQVGENATLVRELGNKAR